ncbi:MAG: leucine-rich repeat domain-containing protein [Pirellulaceae bacterium]
MNPDAISSPPTISAGRAALLSGRWHTSSRVLMGLILLVMVLLNGPGQVTHHVDRVSGLDIFDLVPQYEHGWPLTHLVRQEKRDHPWSANAHQFSFPTIAKCWQFWDLQGSDTFFPGRLVANVAIGFLISVAAGWLFEMWRRRHRSLLQIHLLDIGLATTAVGALLAWYVAARSAHQREEAALSLTVEEMTEHGLIGGNMFAVEREQGGPTWLRLCLGDRPFEFLDRVIVARIRMGNDLSKLAAFPHLRKASVSCRNPQELEQLARFRELEDLDLGLSIQSEVHRDGTGRLPPFPKLRILTLRSWGTVPTGLDQLQNLQVLDMHYSPASPEAFQEIGRLRRLKQLSLGKHASIPEAMVHLASLVELETLSLNQPSLNDPDAVHLARLPALKVLATENMRASHAAFERLSKSQTLELLSVSNMTGAGLKALGDAPRLETIIVESPDKALREQPEHHGWTITRIRTFGNDAWVFSKQQERKRE